MDFDQFSSAKFAPWQFPRAHLKVGTDLPFAVAYAVAEVLLLSPCSWASPGASRLQDLHLAMLLCSQRICDTIRNRRYRIFCSTLCLFLKPSNRKFPCLESFNFETPLRKWNIFWLRNRTHCLSEEQNRRYRDATLYLSKMRFWSKSQGLHANFFASNWKQFMTKIHVWHYCQTCWLYRVTKIMEIFREKTGGGGLYSVTALINTVVLRCRRNIAVRIHWYFPTVYYSIIRLALYCFCKHLYHLHIPVFILLQDNWRW